MKKNPTLDEIKKEIKTIEDHLDCLMKKNTV